MPRTRTLAWRCAVLLISSLLCVGDVTVLAGPLTLWPLVETPPVRTSTSIPNPVGEGFIVKSEGPGTRTPTTIKLAPVRASDRSAGFRTWTGGSVSTESRNEATAGVDFMGAVWVSARSSARSDFRSLSY